MSKPPAYAKEVIAKRQRGERIGLLVVAIHDWQAGKWFEGRQEVSRVVVPQDLPPNSIRFDCAHALDVLLCGSGSNDDLDAVADALTKAEPASIWAEFDSGIWRIERVGLKYAEWCAVDGPFPVQWLARAVQNHRSACLISGRGIYSRPVFAEARRAAFISIFGDDAPEMMREIMEPSAASVERVA